MGGLRVFIAPDGLPYIEGGTSVDGGCWRITPEGSSCRGWNAFDGGRTVQPRLSRDT